MNTESRLSTLESEARRYKSDIESLWQNVERRNQNHLEIMSTLAVILSKQDDFIVYMGKCEDDRNVMQTKINNLESYNSTQKTIVAVIAAGISALGTGIGYLMGIFKE